MTTISLTLNLPYKLQWSYVWKQIFDIILHESFFAVSFLKAAQCLPTETQLLSGLGKSYTFGLKVSHLWGVSFHVKASDEHCWAHSISLGTPSQPHLGCGCLCSCIVVISPTEPRFTALLLFNPSLQGTMHVAQHPAHALLASALWLWGCGYIFLFLSICFSPAAPPISPHQTGCGFWSLFSVYFSSYVTLGKSFNLSLDFLTHGCNLRGGCQSQMAAGGDSKVQSTQKNSTERAPLFLPQHCT